MCVELKIKAKHLAEEARIIRHEEQKLKKQAEFLRARDGLDTRINPHDGSYSWKWPKTPLGITEDKFNSVSSHRRWNVRNEARATNLARAFIAGKTYSSVERNTDFIFLSIWILPRTLKMIQKYHNNSVELDDLKKWIKT